MGKLVRRDLGCAMVHVLLIVYLRFSKADKILVACDDSIYSADSNSTIERLDFTEVITLDVDINDMTHDPNSQDIYVTSSQRKILVIREDQSYTVIDSLAYAPRGICLFDDMLLWTDPFNILRSSLDGTNKMVIHNSSIDYFWGIDVDQQTGTIYSLDFFTGNVSSGNFDNKPGTFKEVSDLGNFGMYAKGIAIDEDERYLYASSKGGHIIKYHLDQNAQYSFDIDQASYVHGISILGKWLLVVDHNEGLLVVNKSNGEEHSVPITGLDNCQNLQSTIDVILQNISKDGDSPVVTSASMSTIFDSTPHHAGSTDTSEWKTSEKTTENTSITVPNFTTESGMVDTSSFGVDNAGNSTYMSEHMTNTSTYAEISYSTVEEGTTTESALEIELTTTTSNGLYETEPEPGLQTFTGTTWNYDKIDSIAAIFENGTRLYEMEVEDVLDNWEFLNSYYPNFADRDRENQYIDTHVMPVGNRDVDPWDIHLTNNNQRPEEMYDLRIVFPQNALNEVDAGHNLVISILKLNSINVTSVDDDIAVLGSRILSMTMFDARKQAVEVSLNQPFEMMFDLLSTLPRDTGNPTCRFLTSTREWSSDGCSLSGSNISHVTCSCDHMTSFAVLMQVVKVDVPIQHQKALSYVSYITLSVSILCLAATIIIFIAARLFKNDRIIIHINLAISQLLAQLLFVTGSTAKNKMACVAVTVLLHYLWLVVFLWMVIEGLHVFLKVNPSITWKIKLPICAPLAWGITAIIAILTFVIGKKQLRSKWQNWTSDNNLRCWLPFADGLIYAFTVPALSIITVNAIFLVIIIRRFLALKANQDRSHAERAKAGVRAVAILIPLLGTTWIFGILQFESVSATVFAYLFNIGNGLHGLFIFITQCLLDDDVKSFLKKIKAVGRVEPLNANDNSGNR